MEKALAALVMALLGAVGNSHDEIAVPIHCASQPPMINRTLEIQLNDYATVICEHENNYGSSLSNEFWYLSGYFQGQLEGGHAALETATWEGVHCLFAQNKTCSRYSVTIAATSNEFNNKETKGCSIINVWNLTISECDQKSFTVRIKNDTKVATPSPTIVSLTTTASENLSEITDAIVSWTGLNQSADVLSLFNIANNILQTTLLVIAILALRALYRRNEHVNERCGNEDVNGQREAGIPSSFDMHNRGDGTDAFLSTLLNNDSAIDMEERLTPV